MTKPQQPTGPRRPEPTHPQPSRPPRVDPAALLDPRDMAAAKQHAADAPNLPRHARDVLHALYGPHTRKTVQAAAAA